MGWVKHSLAKLVCYFKGHQYPDHWESVSEYADKTVKRKWCYRCQHPAMEMSLPDRRIEMQRKAIEEMLAKQPKKRKGYKPPRPRKPLGPETLRRDDARGKIRRAVRKGVMSARQVRMAIKDMRRMERAND